MVDHPQSTYGVKQHEQLHFWFSVARATYARTGLEIGGLRASTADGRSRPPGYRVSAPSLTRRAMFDREIRSPQDGKLVNEVDAATPHGEKEAGKQEDKGGQASAPVYKPFESRDTPFRCI